jgi:hypothetical protein
MTKSRTSFAALVLLIALGCSSSDGGNDGADDQVDALCRGYCGNELMGPDCGPDRDQTVEDCYNRCLNEFSQRTNPTCPLNARCDSVTSYCAEEAMWEYYGCAVSLECNDQFGDCNDAQQQLNDCENQFREDTQTWCAQNCPDDPGCGGPNAPTWGRACRIECETDAGCPAGTYCREDLICIYDCGEEQACPNGGACDDRGRCVPTTDPIRIGAQCTDSAACESADEPIELVCLTQFTGGYCGLEGCTGDVDCPEGSACVTHDDGNNYCFRVCVDKPDCNRNRDEENWSNCVGSITFVDDRNDRKVCEPPSAGL